jgi:transposase
MRVKIIDQTVHGEDASSALIKLAPDLRYRPICHQCGFPAATIHSQGHRRYLRDLNMTSAEVWLQVEYRKIWCNNCGGAKVEHLGFADGGRLEDLMSQSNHPNRIGHNLVARALMKWF